MDSSSSGSRRFFLCHVSFTLFWSEEIPRRVELRRADEGLRGELARAGRDGGRGEHLGFGSCYRPWGPRLPVVEIRM